MDTKPKMGLIEFAEQLITTGDLDPVYVVLHNAQLPKTQLHDWLLSYWCFYSMATASIIVDSGNYWKTMHAAAASKTYQRGSERRHFRGQQSIKAMAELAAKGKTPTQLITSLHQGQTLTAGVLMERVKQWRGFGDWIAFKVADMLETLGIAKVKFSPKNVFNMFDSPVEGAHLAIDRYKIKGGHLEVYKWITKELKHFKAPPLHNRPLGIQEVETILCKWKSHLGGHYPPGKDIKEIHEALRHCQTKTAKKLLKAGSGTLW